MNDSRSRRGPRRDALDKTLAGFEGLSLAQLDERAALLRRVDTKYAVELEQFAELLDRLREDHEVLEIDGRRQFGYRSRLLRHG